MARAYTHQPMPRTTLCCVRCTALSGGNHRSVYACFQMLSGGLPFLQVAGSPSDRPITIPGVTPDSDTHVSMTHQAPSTAHAPEAARAAGECMTAAREEVGISQENDNASSSSDAESASLLSLSDVEEEAVADNAVQADDTESAESNNNGTTLKVIPHAFLAVVVYLQTTFHSHWLAD